MMKLHFSIYITLFFVIHGNHVYSQNTDSLELETDSIVTTKNAIFLELGGNGIFYSLNYDRLFPISEKVNISSRVGIHYTNGFPLEFYRTMAVPIEVSGLYSIHQNKHFIEIGAGITYLNNHDLFVNQTENILACSFRAGYRFQNPSGGFFFKIGFVPLYDFYVENPIPDVPRNTWLFSGGIGFGVTF